MDLLKHFFARYFWFAVLLLFVVCLLETNRIFYRINNLFLNNPFLNQQLECVEAERENEREKNMSTTSKKQVVVDLVPNNYEEQPSLVEGNAKVYKEKVATTIDDLDTLGKFVTVFQVIQSID